MSLFNRADQNVLFLRISDETPVKWLVKAVGRSFDYHASVDGKVAVCLGAPVVGESPEAPKNVDRSNDVMTCENCQDLVKRVASDRCEHCTGLGCMTCRGFGRVRKQRAT